MAQTRRANEARDLREDVIDPRPEHGSEPGFGEAGVGRTARRGSVALVREGMASEPVSAPAADPDAERPSGIYARPLEARREAYEDDDSLDFPTPPPAMLPDDFRDLGRDPELDRIWRQRRPRRALVKTVGWALVAASAGLLALLATLEPASSGMAEWASFGLLDERPPAWAAPEPDPDLSLLLGRR